MNLLKSLATISGLTLVSRILAFVRDVLIARVFGAGMATDAFFVAFKLPNLLRRLFAEGAFSQAFVPIFGEYRNRRGHEETQLLVDHVTTMLALILFVVTLVGITAAPVIVYISAPGFLKDAPKFDLTVQLLRITTPYIFFISLVAVAAGILNTYNRFWVPAFAPILLNVCFIAGALWLAPYFDPPIMALAWAVFIAGIVQLAFQIPFLKKIGMLPNIRFSLKDAGMRRVIKLMGPAVFGVSIAQISLIINTIFASFLAVGSVSWLYYADRLMEFPSGMLGAALGTILLPSLSKCFASNNTAEYSRLLDWGLRLTFMLTLPAALALGMIAVPLLATFFQHGAFVAHDVLMTSRALIGYSVGLIGLITGEDTRARFLRAAGHQDAGEDRRRHIARDTGDERGVHRLDTTRRTGAVDRPRRVPEFRDPVPLSAQARHLPARTRLGKILLQNSHCDAGFGTHAVVRHGQRTKLAGQFRLVARATLVCAGRRRCRGVLRRAGCAGFQAEGFFAACR